MTGKIFFILFLLVTQSALSQDENTKVVGSFYTFEKGSTARMYGDNVVLRAKPSKESDAIDTLTIGDEVTIIERMEQREVFYKAQSNWYKVKQGRKTGYVLGGWIALDYQKIGDDLYLVTSSGNLDFEHMTHCRLLRSNEVVSEVVFRRNTDAFYIETFDDKGIKGIRNMLRINLYAEACGVDGGEIYLFNDGVKLIEAIELTSVSEAGVFWFHETLIFPNDKDGYYDGIIYEREQGEPKDESINWSRSVINRVILQWENGAFTPDLSKFEFDAE